MLISPFLVTYQLGLIEARQPIVDDLVLGHNEWVTWTVALVEEVGKWFADPCRKR